MEDIHGDQEDLIKDYPRCYKCKAPIIFRSNIVDRDDKRIPLDLNEKRHLCTNADRVLHELRVVNGIKDDVDFVNRIELSSFRLTIGME